MSETSCPPSSPCLEIVLTGPLELREPLCALLWELEVAGVVEEELPGFPPRMRLVSSLSGQDPEPVRARLRVGLEALLPLLPGAGDADLQVRQGEVLERNWDAEWRASLLPVTISDRLSIAPRWQARAPARGEVLISIEPGAAFGTGMHESTRGCLRLLDALFGGQTVPEVRPFRGPVEVLDVGTGTGILLITALRLGAIGGEGIDLDPEALAVARANCAFNGVSERARFSEQSIRQISGTFRLVIANLLAPVLIELGEPLCARAHQQGALLLSGLVSEQVEEVLQHYQRLGFWHEARVHEGGWATLLLRSQRSSQARSRRGRSSP